MFRVIFFYLAPVINLKAIYPTDLKANRPIRHNFVMAYRTCPIAHDLPERLLKSHMTL